MHMQYHSLRRTSPKGGPSINVCVLCGEEELVPSDVFTPCPNQRGLTQTEALVEAVTGKPKDG